MMIDEIAQEKSRQARRESVSQGDRYKARPMQEAVYDKKKAKNKRKQQKKSKRANRK